MIFLFRKYFILVLILLIASVSIYSNDVRADKPGYDLQKYLKTSLKESRELKEEEINITEKEIALEKEIADQELRPSPLLFKKAELELRLAEKKKEVAEDEIINQLVNDFFNYYKAENLIIIHRRYTNILEKELKNIEEKYEQGILIKTDLLKAESELQRAESNLQKALNNKEKLAFKLKQNLNMDYNNKLEINFKENTLRKLTLNKSLEELMQSALNNRLEIKEAEANIEIKKISYKISSADYSSKLSERSAENELINAENRLEIVKDMIRLDVNNKYLNHEDHIEDKKQYKKLIESLNEALRIKKLYFEADYITGTELLETEVELYQAEINYLHAEIDYYLSLAELYLSTGDFKEMLIYAEK